MTTTPSPGVVIVGSGLGGYTLARELRKRSPAQPITIITADGGESYSKPMLSNALAQGKEPVALAQKSSAQMAEEVKATVLIRHRVTAIDRSARRLTVAGPDGAAAQIGYDGLVLALGANPRPYTVPGAEQVTIHTVNDLDDYARWRRELTPNARVLLIGAGLIGCEFANDLAAGGRAVTMVDPAPWPLGRLLPEVLGRDLALRLEEIGVTIKTGRSVAQLESGRARLDDNSETRFDLALSAIGLVPRTALAAAAGLSVDKGIVVDALLRTSDPDIYAIGDCAQTAAGPLPFILPLLAEARALAATLAGEPTPVYLPAMPVVVKTPCLPLAVCPPPPGATGSWVVSGDSSGRTALFQTAEGQSIGFAVSGSMIGERQALGKTMPDVLSP